ncbi:hypothetical protein MESS4_p20103 [Mesorhizobium sp. STM 4661]|nr:hypothetical protein MESS4_p20103 [Mesorhizobium sp. STM 4661]
MDNAEPDVLADMTSPKERRAQLDKPNERFNGEI